MSKYDMNIHSDTNSLNWAKFFIKTKEDMRWTEKDIDTDLMLGWFANAMMAMHDHIGGSLQSQLKQKDEEINKLYDIIQTKNIEESFIKSELIGVTEQLKKKDEEIEKLRGGGMSDDKEFKWNQEYKDFMLSFYPESSPLVSTWEIYKTAKRKSQKEIDELLSLADILNKIRDNLQQENRELLIKLSNLQEKYDRAVRVINYYAHDGGRDVKDIDMQVKQFSGHLLDVEVGGKKAREFLESIEDEK